MRAGIDPPNRKSRISLELPTELVERLELQADCLGTSRTMLIETAALGLVREFEEIDTEEGRPCTCGSPNAHARDCRYQAKPPNRQDGVTLP